MVAVSFHCLASGGCEREELPPADAMTMAAASQPAIDANHSITIHADRRLGFTNVVLVIQRDAGRPNMMGVSLTTARQGPDGSRMIFGKLVRGSSPADLLETEVRLSSAPAVDYGGNGIFTPLAVYQPKSATLKIEELGADAVKGTLCGRFRRFAPRGTRERDRLIEVKAEFDAILIVR